MYLSLGVHSLLDHAHLVVEHKALKAIFEVLVFGRSCLPAQAHPVVELSALNVMFEVFAFGRYVSLLVVELC